MNFNNYTVKAQEAIQKATEVAALNQQMGVESGHILKGLIEADESVSDFIFRKLNSVPTIILVVI